MWGPILRFLGNPRKEVIPHNFISEEDETLTRKVQKGSPQLLSPWLQYLNAKIIPINET